MTMYLVKQTDKYAYYHSKLSGVGRFLDRTTHEVARFETGTDHIDLMKRIKRMDDATFNKLAATYNYED